MGVPKFYRWISERYPTLSEVIRDSQIPEFDNLYLDMNGIIHQCSHPNDDDVTFRITEEQIFEDIFEYIERLFMIIRPQKVFFMAVDGVAPRAKMNQQRARRFMSARTAQEQLEKAMKKGEEIPSEKRFDSNCITPGTPFMTQLQAALGKWVERKIEGDSRWQNIRIILSGHNVPGEGEHKIMDFIRTERIRPDYDPNTRHCMYGLDADLIMLGICSHEPHFSLLREEVKFGRPQKHKKANGKKGEKEAKKPPSLPSETKFHLLHLSLMREYLYWEFHSLKDKLSFEYDMERIVDDWILMCFLVGNDFLPHLPHVHIHDDGLPFLYDSYRKVLPKLDGYINEAGYLNLKRFEQFLKFVAENDRDHFLKILEDESFLKGKREQSRGGSGGSQAKPGMYDALMGQEETLVVFEDSDMSSATEDEEDEEEEKSDETSGDAAFVSSDEDENYMETEPRQRSSSDEILTAAEALADLGLDDPGVSEFAQQMALAQFAPLDEKEFESNVSACWSRTIGNSFKRHKREYYKEKMKFGNISRDQLKAQSEGYVRAIQWVLHYYYHGCTSWNWYFEHHYAPYISDVTDFSNMEMNFELSEPFHPFEQLLAVLPAASAECLPPVLRELMCSSESPIADFYPTDFKTDLNGKKNEWEAVVLIPFIDEKKLLEAIRSKEPLLKPEEKERNKHGEHIEYTTDQSGPQPKVCRTLLHMDKFRISKDQAIWGLLPNVKMDVFFPGFPTMKHLPHTGELRNVNVSVFQQASRKPSMVLKIGKRYEQEKDLSTVAADLIGKEVCVEWPVLKLGLVDHVKSSTHCYRTGKNGELQVEELSADDKPIIKKKMMELKDMQIGRYAIDCGDPKAIVYVKRFLGVNYEAKEGSLLPRKQYGGLDNTVMIVPINLVVSNIVVEEGRRLETIPIEKAYPAKSRVFVMSPTCQAFGYPCLVDSLEDVGKPNCRVRVICAVLAHPDIKDIQENIQKYSLPWFDAFSVSKKIGVHRALLGRITGTVFLVDGDRPRGEERSSGSRINIGVNLKFTKRNMEVPDYTKKTKENYWLYSSLTVNILEDYKRRFPEIFQTLERATDMNDEYYTHEIWEKETVRTKRLEALKEYLAELPTANAEKQEVGMKTVDCLLLSNLEKAVKSVVQNTFMFKGSVVPCAIYKPDLYDGKVRPDPEADFQLLDRVVNTVPGVVPFGQLGTVIGVAADKIEVLFDKEFKGGYKKNDLASVARVPVASLINITFGKERKGKPKPVDSRGSTSRKPHSGQQQRLPAGNEAASNRKSQNKEQSFNSPKEQEKSRQILQKIIHSSSQTAVAGPSTSKSGEKKTEQSERPVKVLLRTLKENPAEDKQTKGEDDMEESRRLVMKLLKQAKENPAEEKQNKGEDDTKKKIENQLSSLLGINTGKPLQQKENSFEQLASKTVVGKEESPAQAVKILKKQGKKEDQEQPAINTADSEPVEHKHKQRGSPHPAKLENEEPNSTSQKMSSKKNQHHKEKVFINSHHHHQVPPQMVVSGIMQPGVGPYAQMPVAPIPSNYVTQLGPSLIVKTDPQSAVPSQSGPVMIPTSNMDKMNVTDLRPSTISQFKRGHSRGGRGSRGGSQRPVPPAQPKVTSSGESSVTIKQPGDKKPRRSRLAATFSSS